MDAIRNYRTNSTQWHRGVLGLQLRDESTATNQYRIDASKDTKKRSFLLATTAVAFALLPLSVYGLVGEQNDAATNSDSVQAPAADRMIQFNLVPAANAIADCFPNATAKVKVLLTEEEVGTDTFMLSAKGLRPNTTFAVFLTELPVPPFGAVQYIADFTTNPGGKGSVEVNAIIKEAFSSQVVDGQRVRKELNHVVFWFANPADADACFAPATAPIGPFDGDGEAGPAAMSSKNALPGAPLP
jgi:hypothetical protein